MIELLRREFGADEWEDRGDGLWRAEKAFGVWQYVLIDQDADLYAGCPAGGLELAQRSGVLADFEAEIRRYLTAEIDYMRRPACVVPRCGEKGSMTFKAAEDGPLAGRWWNRGDEIHICPRHATDIYRAQGVYGRDQLAEWLREDARLDPLDAYDAGTDGLYGREIAEQRARMLLMRGARRDRSRRP